MLDRFIKPQIAPFLQSSVAKLSAGGIDDKKLISASLVSGLTGCFFAGMAIYPAAIIFLILNRVGMGLSVFSGTTPPAWAFSRLIGDFAVFAAFVFFFTLGAPATSMAAAFCIFGILLMGLAFTAHAMIASVTGGGPIENTEMTAFMIICCLMPQIFAPVAMMFGLLCFVTAGMRVVSVFKALRN